MNINEGPAPGTYWATGILPQGYGSFWGGAGIFPIRPRWTPEMSKEIEKAVDQIAKTTTLQTMKALHLSIGVLARINHFHALQADFSAHDITVSLRDKVADGSYDIVDVYDTISIRGQNVKQIKHDDVKAIVRELFDLDLIPDYVPQNDPAGFIRYTYASATPVVAATTPVVPAVPVAPQSNVIADVLKRLQDAAAARTAGAVSLARASATQGQTAVNALTAATSATALAPTSSDMWNKAETYVRNKRAVGYSPTLKQIQSRLKGYSVTCADLKNYFEGKRGYSVVKHADLSKSYVR